jgi:hypothetical protein
MRKRSINDLACFRRKAISDLDKLKCRYLRMVHLGFVESPELGKLEKAVRLLPGLLKTEEGLLSSVEESERRKRLETSLEPLFRVLGKVLGAEFDRKREEIIAALEAELKSDGAS